MPKKKPTYYGAGDFGEVQFREILRGVFHPNKVPKGMTWAKFMKYMEAHPEEITIMCGIQEEAVELLWWGMFGAVDRFTQKAEDEAPE